VNVSLRKTHFLLFKLLIELFLKLKESLKIDDSQKSREHSVDLEENSNLNSNKIDSDLKSRKKLDKFIGKQE
jgi:hypothetical protein